MISSPIKNLEQIIANMDPVLGPTCVFSQLDKTSFSQLREMPIAMFAEAEGITVIFAEDTAHRLQLPVQWRGTQITLNVNSSLDAVGFLAAMTSALAEEGISVNAFSPVSHDHLFVRPEDAARAMEVLCGMR